MPKKPKISAEQAQINKEYRKARDRLLSRIRRLSKKDIVPLDYEPPKIPKKKTEASIRKIEKEIERLSNKQFINRSTGEVTNYKGTYKTRKTAPEIPKPTVTPSITPEPENADYSTTEEFDEEGYDLYQRYLDKIDELPTSKNFVWGKGRHRKEKIVDYSDRISKIRESLINRYEEAVSSNTLSDFFQFLRDNEGDFFSAADDYTSSEYDGDANQDLNEIQNIIDPRPMTIEDLKNNAPYYAANSSYHEIK